jgi:hypothetical protein
METYWLMACPVAARAMSSTNGWRSPTGVALVGDERHRAALGDEEVRTGDADVGVADALAEPVPREVREFFGRLQGFVGVEALVEQFGDAVRREVHRRADDVAGGVVGDLEHPLAEVGLVDVETGRFEVVVQVDLLGGHRLRLHDGVGVGVVADRLDVGVRVGRVVGDVDVAAVRLD